MAVKNIQTSFAGMSKKQHALLKKLDSRLKLYGKGQFALPINRFVESVSILCRGDDPLSWFAEDKTPLRILCRVKGLDEEGLAMHLTEMAKVFQWILWQPLLSDSKTHPERCWREEVYSSPSEFLIDQVDERHQQSLIQLCSERWDTCMMLGGATQVIQLIKQHIKKDNDALKSSIRDWMRDLKWHQEWDWERLAETAFFNKSGAFDTFWESDDYVVPERFAEHIVWRRKDRASGVIASVKKLLPNPYRTPGDYGEEEKQERVCTPSPRRSGRSSSVEKMKQSSLKRFFNSKKKAGSAKKAKKAARKSNNKKMRARSASKTLRKSRKRLSRRRSVAKKRSKSRSSGKKRSASKRRRSASKQKRSASRKRSSKKPSKRRAKSRSASKKGSKKRSRSASKKKRSRSASKKKRSASRKSSNKKSSKKRNSKSRNRSRSASKKNRSRSASKKKGNRSPSRHRSASKTRSRSKKRTRAQSRSSSKRARRRVVKSRSRSASKAAKRRSASKH